MKIRSNLLIIAMVTFVSLISSTVLSEFQCDETIFCSFKGTYNNIDGAEEEFRMLMEPSKHANFREMFSSFRYIVYCSEENKECAKALKNPNCSVSVYTQKLVDFYKVNTANIKDDIVKKLFKHFRDGQGKVFFENEIVSD